jgi:GNAT superfamily N-acetyltransferase
MEHLHINGLRFRPIRGEKDAPDLVAIHLDRKERDQVDPLSTLESIPSLESMQRSLTHAMAKARGEDWLVAEVDERVVGYGRIASWPERDGTWIYLALGWITPDWRGQGIGTALLYQTEERIRYLVRREHPNEKIELAANASSTETEATALLLHEGYRVAYTLAEMSFEDTGIIKTQAMPGGFEVRPTSPDHTLLIARSVYEAYEDEYPGGRYDASGDPDDRRAGAYNRREGTSGDLRSQCATSLSSSWTGPFSALANTAGSGIPRHRSHPAAYPHRLPDSCHRPVHQPWFPRAERIPTLSQTAGS